MDQKKTGELMKALRKQKGLTQEQIAEQFNVSNRTVSRWENGIHMPDLDILIEMAEYYDIDLGDLLRGEKEKETMNQELKETVMQVAGYSNEEKKRIVQRLHLFFVIGVCAGVIYGYLLVAGKEDSFIGGLSLGIMFGMTIVGAIVTSRYAVQMRNAKMRLLRKISG